MAVVISPQRARTDGGSDGCGRREAQGRDHRRLGGPDGLPVAGRRGRARRALRAGLLPRRRAGGPGRARPARPLRRRPGPAPLPRGAAAGRGQAAGLQPQARAARLAVDPYRGRDRQRRHAVPGRQRRHRADRHGLGIHLVIHPVLAVRRDETGRLVDLGHRRARSATACARASCMSRSTGRATPRLLAQLEADLRRVLGDVRRAVEDWRAMRDRIEAALEPRCGLARPRCRPSAGRGGGVPALARRRATSPCWATAATRSRTSADGVQLRRMKGTALGILRASRRRRPVAELQQPAAEIRARAREPLPLL